MFALAAFCPDQWRGAECYEHNGAIDLDADFLSEDFCVLGGQYYMVRAVLEIPVHGIDQRFSFGAWSTLSRDNFDKYLAGFDDGAYPDTGPWSGWLCNSLADYTDADPLALWVCPQPDRQRPSLFVQADTHPLAMAQDNGISPERVMELYDFYGHRPRADG